MQLLAKLDSIILSKFLALNVRNTSKKRLTIKENKPGSIRRANIVPYIHYSGL